MDLHDRNKIIPNIHMATDITQSSIEAESEELRGTDIKKYDFKTKTTAVFKARKGIDEEIVNQISDIKEEPDWMRKFRLDSLKIFNDKPMPCLLYTSPSPRD